MRIPLEFRPGLVGDDSSYAVPGTWRSASNVRFWRGRAEVIGGWEAITSDTADGVCRNLLPWTDNDAVLNIAVGSHSALEVLYDGLLSDITPTLARPAFALGNNPAAVTNGSDDVTLTVPAGHGLVIDDSITLTGLEAVGTVTINGTWTVTAATDTTITFTAGSNANADATGGGDDGVLAPQHAFADGAIDGTGGAGYGTGTYSTGEYSEPSTQDYWPRTWALSTLGQNLIANPRRGAIYQWENDTGTAAAPIQNSPRQVEYALVGPHGEVFAFGCNEELSGEFNPLCIRHSSVRDAISPMVTVWNTDTDTTAREYILEGGGRIVGARLLGEYLLVWTDNGLHLGTFVGAIDQVWRFEQVGRECGLIGPNAAVVVGQRAFWLAPDAQFRSYALGGAVDLIPCPIKTDTVEKITASQGAKVTAAHIARFGEIRFDFPHEDDGSENSRYVSLSLEDGTWSQGEMARSAFSAAGPAPYPIGASPAGGIYWHEKGAAGDGGNLSWFIESNDQYLDENSTGMVRGVWPDIAGQIGPVNMTVYSRLKPQGDERSQGPKALAVSEDKKDFRLTGRLFRIRLAGDSAPAYARLGRITVDFAAAGMR